MADSHSGSSLPTCMQRHCKETSWQPSSHMACLLSLTEPWRMIYGENAVANSSGMAAYGMVCLLRGREGMTVCVAVASWERDSAWQAIVCAQVAAYAVLYAWLPALPVRKI